MVLLPLTKCLATTVRIVLQLIANCLSLWKGISLGGKLSRHTFRCSRATLIVGAESKTTCEEPAVWWPHRSLSKFVEVFWVVRQILGHPVRDVVYSDHYRMKWRDKWRYYLGFCTVKWSNVLTFRKNALPPSSGWIQLAWKCNQQQWRLQNLCLAKCKNVALQTENKTAACTAGRTVLQHIDCCL